MSTLTTFLIITNGARDLYSTFVPNNNVAPRTVPEIRKMITFYNRKVSIHP